MLLVKKKKRGNKKAVVLRGRFKISIQDFFWEAAFFFLLYFCGE